MALHATSRPRTRSRARSRVGSTRPRGLQIASRRSFIGGVDHPAERPHHSRPARAPAGEKGGDCRLQPSDGRPRPPVPPSPPRIGGVALATSHRQFQGAFGTRPPLRRRLPALDLDDTSYDSTAGQARAIARSHAVPRPHYKESHDHEQLTTWAAQRNWTPDPRELWPQVTAAGPTLTADSHFNVSNHARHDPGPRELLLQVTAARVQQAPRGLAKIDPASFDDHWIAPAHPTLHDASASASSAEAHVCDGPARRGGGAQAPGITLLTPQGHLTRRARV